MEGHRAVCADSRELEGEGKQINNLIIEMITHVEHSSILPLSPSSIPPRTVRCRSFGCIIVRACLGLYGSRYKVSGSSNRTAVAVFQLSVNSTTHCGFMGAVPGGKADLTDASSVPDIILTEKS